MSDISTRDFLAGLAMQSTIEKGVKDRTEYEGKTYAEIVADQAYYMADAMMIRRASKKRLK